MPPVRDAITRYIKWPSPEFTDIYNRAYEAVYNAILESSQDKQAETYKPLEIRIDTPRPSKKRRRRK